MNRIIILVIIISGITQTSEAQTFTYDSFDITGVANWIFIDNNLGGEFKPEHPNPSKDLVNNSDRVAKFVKPEGATAEVFFFLEKPFDLSADGLFSLLVHGNKGTKINMKLQHNDLNYMAHLTEIVKSHEIKETGTWEEVIFDFSGFSSRTDLDKLVIEIDTSVKTREKFYFDVVKGPAYVDTAKITYARTSFDGQEIIIKCNKFIKSKTGLTGFSAYVNDIQLNLTSIAVVDSFEKMIALKTDDEILPQDNIILQYENGNIESKEGWPLKNQLPIEVANATGKDTILVWADEFNNDHLDTTTWTRLEGEYWFNNELQAYTASPANSYCENGILKITAREEKYGIRNYTSARIVSRYHADFRYGRIEAKMKMPEGKGIWPAFWMMPTEDKYGSWPSSGEIDIMEFLGHQVHYNHGAVHYGDGLGPLHEQQHGAFYDLHAKRNEGFHSYALEWEPNEFRWYFNNKLFHKASASKTKYHWPFYQDFHFILNVAVGGNWPGNPDETTVFPQTLEVDYVRVFKYNTNKNTTGIAQNTNAKKISILPNPVHSNHEINIHPVPDEDYRFSVYGIDGSQKMHETNKKHMGTIKMDFLPPGIYLVKVTCERKVYTNKIIIE